MIQNFQARRTLEERPDVPRLIDDDPHVDVDDRAEGAARRSGRRSASTLGLNRSWKFTAATSSRALRDVADASRVGEVLPIGF